MKVKDLMTTGVKSCPEYSTLNSAAEMMWENDIGCVPIVDHDNRVVGMLTDRDVCMGAYLQGASLFGAAVTSAMSKRVFSCRPEDDLAVAHQAMREQQVHRLPVVDTEGKLVGIISLNDIAREAAVESKSKQPRQVTDAELAGTLASVCAPRHRIIEVQAA